MASNKLSMAPGLLGAALGAVAGYSLGVMMSDSGTRDNVRMIARKVRQSGSREIGKYTQAIAHQVERGKKKRLSKMGRSSKK